MTEIAGWVSPKYAANGLFFSPFGYYDIVLVYFCG